MPTRAQRPWFPETSVGQMQAKAIWNGGKVGKTRTPADHPVTQTCTVDACGSPVVDQFQPPADGMTRVTGSADGAAEHWYCTGRCAAIACARAELRAIPMRPGGEAR